MRIAFLDLYQEGASPHKDPITIPLALQKQEHDVLLVSCAERIAKSFTISGLPVIPLAEMANGGWRRGQFDAVVVISRFAPFLTPVLEDIKASGLPLIVKGDTDGTLGYPLPPNYLRTVPPFAMPSNLLRHLKWRLPVKYWVGRRLAHVALADRVVVESPGAAINLAEVLRYWDQSSDLQKIRFISNQVSQPVIDRPVAAAKARHILSIARWEDALCKGADILADSILQLLSVRNDYKVTVVGSGIDEVRRRLPPEVAGKITLLDEMSFEALQDIIAGAQILLVPSRMESFSFVTAEALCAGTSIVATPIEALTYFTGGGEWGSLARDFSVSAVSAALLREIDNWETGVRDPLTIAAHWRSRLAPDPVGALWSSLLKEVASLTRC